MSDATVELGDNAAWAAAALVLVAALGGAVVLAEWPLWGVEPDEPEEPLLVEPGEGGTELWPYTARAHDYNSRTLGINVVIHGDGDEIYRALTDRSDIEWYADEIHEGDAAEDTYSLDEIEFDSEADELTDVIGWGDAEGSTRYTYFVVDGEGQWVEESYQLHAGTYLGHRMHIRGYEEPNGEWTAIQVHDEHWDWFRLRHTVTGISDSQRELELDFMDAPFVDDVVRLPFGNETADSDGWVTAIYMTVGLAPLVGLAVATRTRTVVRSTRSFVDERRREIALAAALFGLYTAIRYLGIAGEMAFDVSPKLVAAPLYVALVVGMPAIAYLLGRDSDAAWAFAFAAIGLTAAFVVDFVAMGVSVVPLRAVLHRAAVVLAIALIAVGGAITVPEERPQPLVVGAIGWVVALAAPLFGYL